MSASGFVAAFGLVVVTVAGCSAPRSAADLHAQNLVLITIDTLRADHVGAYGYARAQTPTLDALARTGVRFERAYAAAPITLPSHATLLTGRYPPGHGARDNGIAMSVVPTLATELKATGFRTAAFVAAFPLDHQFGLARGFDVYSDRLGRDANGQPANERPASQVVDDAIAWLHALSSVPAPPAPRFFLWVHLFEPHAPYGDPSDRRPVLERYDAEIASADREVGRLLTALGPRTGTLVVAAGDHGEAFGEHGEYAHSIFVYDTTLRVPLLMNGPGLTGIVVPDAVTLADVAPTAARMLGVSMPDTNGIDVSAVFARGTLAARELYAESFAPLVEFGWAPLRALRSGTWKFIAAPKPELFNLIVDADEKQNVVSANDNISRALDQRVNQISPAAMTPGGGRLAPSAAARLRALGYVAGGAPSDAGAGNRPDPKDRRELAARIARVTSGELEGAALIDVLEGIVHDDPKNGQALLRLGYARLASGDCARAEPAFREAAASGLPSSDVYVGLATCLSRRGDLAGAGQALTEARRLEPDSAVVLANLGILESSKGNLKAAIDALTQAVAADPSLLEARFNLAIALAKAGRRAEAAAAARDLLTRLPSGADQRPEVERLLRAVQ